MSEIEGPIMLAATSVLKPPPLRVSRITEGFKLPRAIPVKVILGVGLGTILGLIIGMTFGGYKSAIWLVLIFGFIGYISVTYSPLKGESLARYLGLRLSSSRTAKIINGEQVRIHVGLTRMTRTALGQVSIRSSAVEVFSNSYDERGVKIDNRGYSS